MCFWETEENATLDGGLDQIFSKVPSHSLRIFCVNHLATWMPVSTDTIFVVLKSVQNKIEYYLFTSFNKPPHCWTALQDKIQQISHVLQQEYIKYNKNTLNLGSSCLGGMFVYYIIHY